MDGVNKEHIDALRNTLPPTVTASVVKNSLLRLLTNGTSFEAAMKKFKGENMYFFIPEGLNKPVYEQIKTWIKNTNRVEANQQLKLIVLENTLFEGKQLEYAANLPTRQEIAMQIIQSIRGVQTRIVQQLDAIPKQVVRALLEALKKKEDAEVKGTPSSS